MDLQFNSKTIMNEKHVTSLDISKKLKELGFPQDSVFDWSTTQNGSNISLHERLKPDHSNYNSPFFRSYSAYLATELGKWLPEGYFVLRSEDGTYLPARVDPLTKTYKIMTSIMITNDWSMANTYACILIYLAEQKIINPEKL